MPDKVWFRSARAMALFSAGKLSRISDILWGCVGEGPAGGVVGGVGTGFACAVAGVGDGFAGLTGVTGGIAGFACAVAGVGDGFAGLAGVTGGIAGFACVVDGPGGVEFSGLRKTKTIESEGTDSPSLVTNLIL